LVSALSPVVESKTILTDADIGRAIIRIAHEILEANRGPAGLVVIGVHTRGVPFARRLAQELSCLEGCPVPVATLDITPFRDDTPRQGPEQAPPLEVAVTGKRVVLVDEVIHTGRTARAALDAICLHGRPERVYLAVLVDRGHRELPIRPDFVGKNIPTARDEYVRVRLQETDGLDAVAIERRGVPAGAGQGGDS
jgi:pyrimidine operon attenuation protein/uracil phosphoribosyltransferase